MGGVFIIFLAWGVAFGFVELMPYSDLKLVLYFPICLVPTVALTLWALLGKKRWPFGYVLAAGTGVDLGVSGITWYLGRLTIVLAFVFLALWIPFIVLCLVHRPRV